MNWTSFKGHRRTLNNQGRKRSSKWVPFYRITLSRLSFSCLKYTILQSRLTASNGAKHEGSFSFRRIPGFQLYSLQERWVIPQYKVKHKIYPTTTSNKTVLQDIKIPLIAAALFMLCHHKLSTGLWCSSHREAVNANGWDLLKDSKEGLQFILKAHMLPKIAV